MYKLGRKIYLLLRGDSFAGLGLVGSDKVKVGDATEFANAQRTLPDHVLPTQEGETRNKRRERNPALTIMPLTAGARLPLQGSRS